MNTRIKYEPTAAQLKKFAAYTSPVVPSDDEFKQLAKAAKKPWGIYKRDWMLSAMKSDPQYQMGIWQGRVDAARGIDYSEERNDSAYNLGYYRGYTDYNSDRRGMDKKILAEFDAKYGV